LLSFLWLQECIHVLLIGLPTLHFETGTHNAPFLLDRPSSRFLIVLRQRST
jgi:hypothetical protein